LTVRFVRLSRLSPVYILTAACFAFMCQPCHAGLFGASQSVPQWGLDAAKTPTPDYAKGSSAVVLYDEYVETVDAKGRAVEREREAFRILEPQGRHKSCQVSYDVDEKINYFREWTIAADGKQFQAKDTDFMDEGAGEEGIVENIPILLLTEKTRIVHPPATDVGSTIICDTEEVLAPYRLEQTWRFQESIPFVFEAFEVDLPPGRSYAASWHRYQPVKPVEVVPNHWRWEIKDMQKLDLRDVKARPDGAALAARMSVTWGDAAVEGTDNQWRAFGLWYSNLEAHRSDPTPEITAQAQLLVTGAPDFYTKLKNITEYIQKSIRYFVVERGVGGWQAHYAGDIFRNRYGDCKDKTTLLISMLQAVGIQAYYVPVDNRRGVVDPDAPSLYGDHMITAIEIPADVNDPRLMAIVKTSDGKRYLIFDPTNERTPVGNLPSYEQGGYGLLAAGPSSQVIALPVLPPSANGVERRGSFTLSADGVLTGAVDTSSTGPAGADIRWALKFTDQKEQQASVEKSVAGDLPGVTLNTFQFVQPPDLDKPLELHYKVTVPQYAHRAGPLVLVRPRVVGDDAVPFDDKLRTVPLDLSATGHWHDSFDIALPPGYLVDELPDPVNVDAGFASYRASVTAKDSSLHYEREYTVRQVEIPATQAADFRKLEGNILADEKGTVVLRKQ
jgi:hypothetical protein